METQTYIECKKNSHGSVLYVYSQSPRSEEDPQLLEEIILPESSDDVYKVVNNDTFIVASFVNHGTQIVSGTGGVMVFKKRNDGKFHFIQTIKLDSEKIVITDENQLNFGIDLELTDENLFITCTPTIENGDKHSYIGVYEYGEFFWELVQEFYGADADNASFKLDEFAYDQLTGKSIYGGINSLAATTTDFVFCSNITESEERPQNQKGFYSCIKLNGTWLLDVENPILHPQCNDDVVGGTVVGNSSKIIGKPCMSEEWLSVSSYKCIKNSELENKLPNEDGDAISFIPCVLIYKKDDDGMFKFFQYLEYEEKCRLSVISEYENITVQMRGDHLVCYDENNLNTTLQETVEAKYFYLDRTEEVRMGSFGKTYCWKYDSDFDFDGLKKPFILGGCPPCHIKDASCGQVVLHLQSTDSEEVVSDACHDTDITDINHRSPMCDLYLNNIESELGYVFNPLTNLTEDVTIDYTQAHNQNGSGRWITYGDYTNLPIELTPRFLSPDSSLRFVHMSNTTTWQIDDPFNHPTGGMRGLQGTLRSTGMNQGALTYTFAKPTMVIAVTTLTSSWNHGDGIIGSWTQYTPRWSADRTCYTVYYKYFEAGDHVITNQGFFLYFRPLDLIPTPTPTVTPIPAPSCDVTLSFDMVLPDASDNGATFTQNLSITQSDSFQEIENVKLFSSEFNDNLSTWNATDLTLTLSSGEEVDVYFKDATTPAETMSNGNAGNAFVVTLIIPPINSDCSFGSTPTPTPTYKLHEMIMNAGRPDQDGLILISWEDREECLPYTANGRNRLFVVPSGVTQINVQVWGAGGGSGRYRYAGGAGGYADGKLDVQPGETYIIGVGQTAKNRSNTPGYSPGGSAGSGGSGAHRGAGAGGGMSGVFKNSVSIENALLIAGGGGGSSGSYQVNGTGGGGGGGTSGGHGSRGTRDNHGGKGGSQTSGGYRGNSLAWSRNSSSGSQFNGGQGGTAGHSSGGGGGAGWFGGGGGGALSGADSAGGGGAGYTHSSVIDGRLFRGDNGRRNHVGVSSYLPNPMPCVFIEPTPTPSPTPTPTPDCPKINWDIIDDDGNTLSKESSTISLNVSKLESGQQRYTNILTGMVGASNDARVIRWGVKDYSSVSNIKLVLCDESEHDPLEKEFIPYSAEDDKTGLRMNLIFGVELTPTPIPQPGGGDDDDDDIGEPTQPIDRPEITASTCETQYLLLQPATDDTAILDKGSETFDVTEKGETKLNSDTKHFDLPTIKVANGDESYPPNNTLETNIGDMIIGTNDFTIETFIKFDDVNQDHRIINQNETSRNRSSWVLFHRGDQKERNGEEGRWFQWLVNNGHGSTSTSNRWINHIAFLSPISLENDTWYHIALVRKNVTNWTLYVNGQKHEKLTNRFMHSSGYSFGSYSGSIPSFSGPTYIGCNHHSTSTSYYMQSFRIANVAVYADEFNVPSSTLGAIDFKPSCESISVDLQKSDSDDSIEDKSGSGISITSDVSVNEQTLSFKMSIGRILVFDYENETWELKFTDEGESVSDQLGYDLSTSSDGNIIAYSTPNFDTDSTSNVSKVTVYDISGSSFTKRTEIIGEITNGRLGRHCKLSSTGDYLVLNKGPYNQITQVLVYKWNGSDYILRDTINGSVVGDLFGSEHTTFDISDDGNILVVSATSTDTSTALRANYSLPPPTVPSGNYGRTTIYKWSDSGQEYLKHGDNINGAIDSYSGKPVHLSRDGSTLLIGSPFTNINSGYTEGSLKIFTITESSYTLIQEIKGDGTSANTQFGYSFELSANGNILIMGNPYNHKVYVYEKIEDNIFVIRDTILRSSLDSVTTNQTFGSKVSINNDGSRIVFADAKNNSVANNAGILHVMDYIDGNYVLLPNTIIPKESENIGISPFQISDNGLRLVVGSAQYDYRETKQTTSFSGSNSDIIVVGNNSDLNFLHNGTTDYTIEFDFNATDLTGSGRNLVRLFSNVVNSSGSVAVDCFVRSNGELTFNIHRGVLRTAYKSFVSPEDTISVNTDYKIAIVFSGGQIKIFLNGIAITNANTTGYSIVNSASKSNATRSLIIGGIESSNEIIDNFKGSITNFKIVRSALYNCNYDVNAVSNECIPPKYYAVTNPDGDTKLLIRSTTSDGIKDIGCQNRTISINGDTAHTESSKLFDTGTINFDGTDSISIPNSKDAFKFLHSGVGADFTVESWIKITQANQYQTIICTASNTGNTGFMLVVHNMKPSVLIGKSVGGRWRLTCGSNTLLNLNTWHHVAVVNVNGKVKLFVDGKLTAESEFADTIVNSPTHNVSIGCEDDSKKQNYFVGQLQDLRISSSAVYSGRFVVPSALFTTDCSDACGDPELINCANDVVLHLQSNTFKSSDPIIDSSVFSRTLTKYGDVTHNTSKSPFGRSSLYFDGTDDYLQVESSPDLQFGTNDFTIEFWVNFPTSSSHFSLQNNKELTTAEGKSRWVIEVKPTQISFITHSFGDTISNSGIVIPVNQWHHLAFVRTEGVMTLYYNGEEVKTGDLNEDYDQNGLNIGSYSRTDGVYTSSLAFIQDLRITNKAVYTTCFSKPTSMFEIAEAIPANEPSCGEVALNIQSDNTDNTDAIEDISVNAHAITNTGPARHETEKPLFGSSSLKFAGGDTLLIDQTNDLNINGDFTLETWVYVNTNPANVYGSSTDSHMIASCWYDNSNNSNWQLLYNSNNEIAFVTGQNGGSIKAPAALNTWHHVAVVGSGNNIKMYLDGTELSDTIQNHNNFNSNLSKKIYIGSREMLHESNRMYLNGYLQDLRISKKAVYTGCFVPPSKLHPNLLNTPLNPNCAEVLLHVQSDTTNVSDAVIDSSRNQYEFTKRGNATHSTDQKIHGASSLYFDGGGDALSINNADTLNEDFTFETWVNLKNIPAESEFTLPSEVASSAIDGELLEITEDTTLEYTDDRISALTSNTITLTSKGGSDFKANQRLLIISTYGANADTIGNYEFVEIASINGNVLTLKSNIQKTYNVANYTFVVAPQRYNKIIVNEDVNVSSVAWSASSDSIQGLVLLSANEIQVKGQISANELGFRGGTIGTTSNKNGGIGESYVSGKWNTRSTNGQYGSGGAGFYYSRGSMGDIGTSGAGAGHGTSGTGGSNWHTSGNAKGGTAFALGTIKEKIFMGPGGGQGGSDNASPSDTRSARGGYGGRGAGIVIIDAIYCEVSETGIISANGQRGLEAYDPGNGEAGNGGGGAGGSILFTGNIDNEGLIQTTRGDRRVADGSGQSSGYGYTSGYGGHGVIAWFGYNVGNNQINCLAHSPWKNTSYILDTHSTETTDFGGNKLGLIAIPSKESGKYDVAYGNLGGKLIRSKLNLTYNEWNHIAVVRKNNIETFYINGSPVSTRTHSLDYPNEIIALGSQSFNNFQYPLELNGYLQDVRISKKAVVEGCFVPPVSLVDKLDIELPNQPECDEINLWLRSDTTLESTAITDASDNNHSVTKHGNTRHETSKKLFGESSLYFDGSGDYLSIPASSDWNIGAGDFTIEFWVNFDKVSQGSSSGHGHGASIIGNSTNNGDLVHEGWFFLVDHSGLVSFIYEDGSSVTNWDYNTLINQIEANKWYHIAVSRNENILKGFVDGLPVHESSFTTYRHSNLSLELGRRTKSPLSNIQDHFKGYLQDVRISNKAVYTGCFKLPTTFLSEECIPTPTPIPQPTPTPTPERTPTPIRTRGILENDTSIGSKIATIQEQYGEFKVGDCVIINKGTDKEEKLQITQISFTAVTGIKYQSCETDYVAPASDPDFELPSVPPKVNILKYEECEGLTLPEIVDYVLPETTDQTKVRKYAYCNDEWTAIETFDYELPDETIQDPVRKYAKCGWVREVTLTFNYHIPNHPDSTSMANGTATKSHTIFVTSGQPVVDFEFYHSFATGLGNEDEWTASNAKLTFPDNTIVSVDLTNRKVTSGTYEHPENGNQTAYAVRYTFDVPNFVQDETQDFLDSIEYLLIVPPATDGVENHNPTIISTDSINPKTLPTEWPTGTTYNYGDN